MSPQINKEEQSLIDWDAPSPPVEKKVSRENIYHYSRYDLGFVACGDCLYGPDGDRNCRLNPGNTNGFCLNHGKVLPEIEEEIKRYWNEQA